MLAPVLAMFSQGMPIVGYLDDLLLREQLAQVNNITMTVQTLHRFRWELNLQTSALDWTHWMEYLNLILQIKSKYSSLGSTSSLGAENMVSSVRELPNSSFLHVTSRADGSLVFKGCPICPVLLQTPTVQYPVIVGQGSPSF